MLVPDPELFARQTDQRFAVVDYVPDKVSGAVEDHPITDSRCRCACNFNIQTMLRVDQTRTDCTRVEFRMSMRRTR